MGNLKGDGFHCGHADALDAGSGEALGERVGDIGFAMDDKERGLGLQCGGEEADQLIPVGVGAEAVDGADLAANIVPAIEDADAILAILKSAAEGIGRGPADEDQLVIGAFHAEFEVMKDSAELAGGAGGDDDAGAGDGVDCLALLHAGCKGNASKAEEVFAGDHGTGLLVEVLREIFVDSADLHTHGAVHENRECGDFVFVDEFLDVPEDGLGSADGEGGDEQSTAVFDAGLHRFEKLLFDAFHGCVGFVAIGAFSENQVGREGDGGGVVEDGGVVSADIRCEQKRTGGWIG